MVQVCITGFIPGRVPLHRGISILFCGHELRRSEYMGNQHQYFIESPVVSLTCAFGILWQHWQRNKYFTINSNSFLNQFFNYYQQLLSQKGFYL